MNPELNCASSPRTCVRDQNFFKNFGREHANALNDTIGLSWDEVRLTETTR